MEHFIFRSNQSITNRKSLIYFFLQVFHEFYFLVTSNSAENIFHFQSHQLVLFFVFLSKTLSTQYKILRIHDSSRESVLFQFARIVQRQIKYLETVMSVKGGEIRKEEREERKNREQKELAQKQENLCTTCFFQRCYTPKQN